MKPLIIVLFLLIYSSTLFSQEVLLEKLISKKSHFVTVSETLPVVYTEKNEILLFLLNGKTIHKYRFDADYNLLIVRTSDRPKKKYSTLLGHNTNPSGYDLVFTNNKKNQFYLQTLTDNSSDVSSKELNLKLKDEEFIKTITYKNKFYLLTAVRKSSSLKIYSIEDQDLVPKANIDFSSQLSASLDQKNLYDLLVSDDGPFSRSIKIKKIETDIPTSLDLSTSLNKLYYYDDKIFISIDKEDGFTHLISIDLADFKGEVLIFEQTKSNCNTERRLKSNSYLMENKLFQILACREGLRYKVTDIHTGDVVKEDGFVRDDEIDFSNTSLIQEGGSFVASNSKRELEETNQLLRKILSSDIGISATMGKDNIVLTLGGIKEIKGGSAMTPMSFGGMPMSTAAGQFVIPPFHFNPVMFGYNSYSNTKSVYFKSMLNKKDYTHKEGEIPSNVFDKIEAFKEISNAKMKAETLFKIDNYYIFSYFDETNDRLYFRKFEN